MNLLILSSHAILEYDDLRLFSDLGYDVFMPGAYSDPSHPGEDEVRPALPNVPHHPELAELCEVQRRKYDRPPGPFIDWAKADLHPDIIEWADVIMVNCFPDVWIGWQWERIRHKRVIWRTIGQSNGYLEHEMRQYRKDGLEIVRYSPAERRAFEPLGVYAGEDAMIRFGKYAADFAPWVGNDIVVGNITQWRTSEGPLGRGDHCGLPFWRAATEGLPTRPAGMGSDALPNGLGHLAYPDLLEYLRHVRAYLYMGTEPASYSLSLMEAMLAGVPTISAGSEGRWQPPLFEAHELAILHADDPEQARIDLERLLRDDEDAVELSQLTRQRGIELFDVANVGPQWSAYLAAVPAQMAVA